jgi:hypothetical protein
MQALGGIWNLAILWLLVKKLYSLLDKKVFCSVYVTWATDVCSSGLWQPGHKGWMIKW